jgi:hypothetical protein
MSINNTKLYFYEIIENSILEHDRYRDDYDDKETAVSLTSVISNADGLVKPAAPSSSVYARPRTPPKIRRPVPLSEQDRYAYKTTPVQPTGKINSINSLDVCQNVF